MVDAVATADLFGSYSRILAEAEDHISGEDLGRASFAFRQVTAYKDGYDFISAELPPVPQDWDSLTPDEEQGLAQAMNLGYKMDSMIRAAVVFGDLANVVLLQEVLGVMDKEPFVTYLSSRSAPESLRAWAGRMDPQALTFAHALRKYRDQIVIHQTVVKISSSHHMTDEMALTRRLVPIHFEGASEKDHQPLEEIAKRNSHLATIREIKEVEEGKHNFWELLEALFYSVHPLKDGEPNGDRRFVDKVAAHGGVKSPTIAETLEIVVAFAKAVVERVKSDGIPAL